MSHSSEDVDSGGCESGASEGQLLVIPADAPLVDGLRVLLVHHLKRSVGSSVINLSASQAELLEHHLSRLASYAQKIVHTLAFATRFLSKQHLDGDQGEAMDSTRLANATSHGLPSGGYDGAMVGGAAAQAPAAEMPRPAKKSLKLNDNEILSLFRSAQVEAAIEADWRGIPEPGACLSSRSGDNPVTSRRSAGTAPGAGLGEGADGLVGGGSADGQSADTEPVQGDRRDEEYLRLISRALQKPGRSPRVVAAEVAEPLKGMTCFRTNVPGVLDGVIGHSARIDGASVGVCGHDTEGLGMDGHAAHLAMGDRGT